MKSIIIIFAFILVSEMVFAQNNSGSIQYIVAHDWLQKRKSSEFVNEKDIEMSSYVWGSDNVYKEYSVLEFNSTSSLYKETEENVDYYSTYSWKTNEYLIYRNIAEGKIYDVIRTLNKLYVIEDTIQYQNWKIRNDMKEVAGHVCMNAYYRDTLKGKDVIAWFALDIPMPYGPDVYGGLPGMILEINENNGAVVITASKISISEEEKIIEKPTHKRKVKKVTQQEYNEILKKEINESKKLKRPYFYNIRY